MFAVPEPTLLLLDDRVICLYLQTLSWGLRNFTKIQAASQFTSSLHELSQEILNLIDAVLAVLFVSVMATFCMEILLAYELPAIQANRNSMNTFFMGKSLTFEKLIFNKIGDEH